MQKNEKRGKNNRQTSHPRDYDERRPAQIDREFYAKASVIMRERYPEFDQRDI